MNWRVGATSACITLIAAGTIGSGLPPAAAAARPPLFDAAQADVLLHKSADSGISVVRMPPRPPGSGPSTQPSSSETIRAPTDPPSQGQSKGRLIKLTARMGSQSGDPLKGWLGVNMESVELPLALSLGLANAEGSLILNTLSGGPASQTGLRFGDIVVGMNGRSVANMNELRQRVSATSPGTETMLDVWRIAADEAEFLQMLRRLADGGNAHVMFRLGRLYANGSGVPRDDAQAVLWYRKGADAGNPSAMTALAIALLDGRGTSVDQPEAVRLLKSASAANNTEAMFRLAHILVEGKAVEKDALEGLRWFTKAAEAGHTPSMVDLARMYANGTGVQADYSKAAMWYKQAADQGHSGGMVGLGWLYEAGRGVEADPVKAATLHRRAADLGNSAGMVALGLLYAQGKGVEKDEVASVNLYRKAVNLNNSAAMNNLAWMLQKGSGVPSKAPEEAADYMMKALDRRNEFSRQQMTVHFNKGWSREFRMAMQKRLQDGGFYTGRIDGNFRESTITAVDAYFNRSR